MSFYLSIFPFLVTIGFFHRMYTQWVFVARVDPLAQVLLVSLPSLGCLPSRGLPLPLGCLSFPLGCLPFPLVCLPLRGDNALALVRGLVDVLLLRLLDMACVPIDHIFAGGLRESLTKMC